MLKYLTVIKYFLIFPLLICTAVLFLTIPAYADNETAPEAVNETIDENATEESKICNLADMKKRYMGDGESKADIEKACWYCRVVTVMTNAYLEAANKALPVSQDLGHLIVKIGFLIWLAIYLLQQVSAFSSTTTGKMLQEILVVGFKCAFANFAISYGITFITQFIINPIMLTGTEIGMVILDEMVKS